MDGLDHLIAGVRAGTATELDLATAMLGETLHLSGSREPDGAEDELLPLTFEVDGSWFIGVFTRLEHAERFAATAPFVVPMSGRRIFGTVPPGVGGLLEPGDDDRTVAIHPATLAALDADG